MKSGDKGYRQFHYQVEKRRGKPSKCEECGTLDAKKYEWANITGDYENTDDYKRLCTSCHRLLDLPIWNHAKGERVGISKLTEDDVLFIRTFRFLFTEKTLARIFNINLSGIGKIVRRETWKHI